MLASRDCFHLLLLEPFAARAPLLSAAHLSKLTLSVMAMAVTMMRVRMEMAKPSTSLLFTVMCCSVVRGRTTTLSAHWSDRARPFLMLASSIPIIWRIWCVSYSWSASVHAVQLQTVEDEPADWFKGETFSEDPVKRAKLRIEWIELMIEDLETRFALIRSSFGQMLELLESRRTSISALTSVWCGCRSRSCFLINRESVVNLSRFPPPLSFSEIQSSNYL